MLNFQIQNSTHEDLPVIFKFYDHAVSLQKKVSDKHWQGFDMALVEREIKENRQYKILVDGTIACVFMVTFNDVEIWKERGQDRAIYLHRIVTHPNFRGLSLVKHITEWAIDFAKNNGLQFVRLDTWADNQKLNDYYIGFGFAPAGSITISPNSGLPKHYEGITLSLFEISLQG